MGKRQSFRVLHSTDLKAGTIQRLKTMEECYEFINNHNLDMALILDGDTLETVELYIADKYKPLDEVLSHAAT
jgi:hypothetical protein